MNYTEVTERVIEDIFTTDNAILGSILSCKSTDLI